MRITYIGLFLAALFLVPRLAEGQDKAVLESRLQASLLRPARLLPPPYLEVISLEPARTPFERCRDESVSQFGYGRMRLYAAIDMEVIAVVFPWDGEKHLVLLDSFDWPDVHQGQIDPDPILRSLGVR